ncbi:MAG TPA: hypothetical protein PLL92_11370 [Alicycliphilus sp.]|nr:hypothetical protein [Alicycliphilus sp.]
MPALATARTHTCHLRLAWLLVGGFWGQAMAQTSFVPPGPALASVEISTSTAPLDTRGESRRLDVTHWLPPGRAGSLGFSFGLTLPTQVNLRPYTTAVAPWGSDVGVRWRTPLGSGHQLDMAVWARTPRYGRETDALGMIWHREQASYGTRLEVQWSSSRMGGLMPEFGAIGVQLEGDSRLLLRAKRGGPMVYYRTRF